jgi:hypothetical protein
MNVGHMERPNGHLEVAALARLQRLSGRLARLAESCPSVLSTSGLCPDGLPAVAHVYMA